jgi:hypothetical protein
MHKNLINPEIFDEYLASAKNASDKGQAQYLTPLPLAAELARALPDHRPVIVDLNAGGGNLLRAAATANTHRLLACDIDPSAAESKFASVSVPGDNPNPRSEIPNPKSRHVPFDVIIHDVTLLAPLLEQTNFRADLFVLNPPWDLHWHRARLNHLADSELDSVSEAFGALDPRLGKDTIDSSVATLLLALHHCSPRGEGYLITNAATANRLILDENAPHHALAKHIWATIKFPMSLFNSVPSVSSVVKSDSPQAIALYFARDHEDGLYPPAYREVTSIDNSHVSSLQYLNNFKLPDPFYRHGRRVRWISDTTENSHHVWAGLRIELAQRQDGQQRNDFNLWLGHDGKIRTQLSIFDESTIPSRQLQREADALKSLDNQTPLSLVTQRAQRDLLLKAAGLQLSPQSSVLTTQSSPWRVDPKLLAAIEQALRDYHSVRAPLYPLPKIQRLAYLEEEDSILCVKDLAAPSGDIKFHAGQRYQITTRTITVKRTGSRPNLVGDLEDIEYTGAELATFITGEDGSRWSFLEARLKTAGVTLKDLDPVRVREGNPTGPQRRPSRRGEADLARADVLQVDFTLQQLADHFEVPKVPDISTSNQTQFQSQLAALDQIQSCMPAALRFKEFQRHDYARLACTDGAVLAHDPGLGKTWAAIVLSLLKCGFAKIPAPICNLKSEICNAGLRPKGAVLIVAPGDLHQQMIDEAFAVFGVAITRLDSQDTFLKLCAAHRTATKNTRDFPDGLGAKEGVYHGDTRPTEQQRPSGKDPYYSLPPGFYLTSFHELGINGTNPPPKPNDKRHRVPLSEEDLATIGAWNYQGPNNTIIEVAQPIKCLYSPTLSDLCANSFACVIVDEATKMKSDDALIAQGVRQLRAPYFFALTATPIKNRIPDIFWLAWRAAGGHLLPTPRFPFSVADKQIFAETFCVEERNITAEEKAAEKKKPKRFRKLTPQVSNIHRLWKLLAPIVLRRRKKDIGEAIAPKKTHVIRVPLGTTQSKLYQVLLEWEPKDKNDRLAVGKLLQSLRMAAAAPHLPSLLQDYRCSLHEKPWLASNSNSAEDMAAGRGAQEGVYHGDTRPTKQRSHAGIDALSVHTPKTHAALNLIHQILTRREQVILFAPFNEPLDSIYYLLEAAGIPALVMDGRTDQQKRGLAAREFKKGPPVLPINNGSSRGNEALFNSASSAVKIPDPQSPFLNQQSEICNLKFEINPDPSRFPIMLAGVECMAEGHNFFRCANGIHYSYSWALDKTLQSDDRYHRLTSPGPVNSYRLVADGSIDRKMESQLDEKEDSSELILDGHLIGEQPAETNLMELLRTAQRDFDPLSKTISEEILKTNWLEPGGLREKLQQAYQTYLSGNAATVVSASVVGTVAPRGPSPSPLSPQSSALSPSHLIPRCVPSPRRPVTNWRALIAQRQRQSNTNQLQLLPA